MRKSLFALFLLAAGAVALPAFSLQAPSAEPAATAAQLRATDLIARLLKGYHYRKVPLDDALSTAVFDRYLKALDPGKAYFLASDVEALSARYRLVLDDALRKPDLTPAFELFGRLRTRVTERSAHAISLLAKKPDFTVNERFELDRDQAAWASSVQELDELWRQRVKNDWLNLKLAGKKEAEIRDTLERRYRSLERNTNQFKSEDIFQLFINAYTETIEPHTAYFSPRSSENFRIRMSLSLEGIGAALASDNEYTVVKRVIPGGPAARSGQLRPEDRIVGVAQGYKTMVDVIGMRLDEVVEMIRGPKGSTVRLEVIPNSAPEGPPRTVALVREEIRLEDQAARKSVFEVEGADRRYKIGVIRLPTFYTDFEARERGDGNFRSTSRDVRRLLDELRAEDVDGVVMDLRGNGGGSLSEATELTGLFIAAGPVVQVRDADGQLNVNNDPDPGMVYDGPLVVLVDRGSASASEIFAGAMQDYRRAIVVGETTYGKGTVQRLMDLDRYARGGESGMGQLKFTVAQFFRINGDSTQYRGVIPDLVFSGMQDDPDDGERALENALPFDAVRPASYVVQSWADDVVPYALARHEKRARSDAGLRWIAEEYAVRQENAKRKSVSLLESERRAQRDRQEQERLARLNRYRASRGMAALAKLEDLDEGEAREKEEEAVFGREGARILADALSFAHARTVAARRSGGSIQMTP
jgi:carboxyl-terminal processing protease